MRTSSSNSPIPKDTVRAARNVLGRENIFLAIGDQMSSTLGMIQYHETGERVESGDAWLHHRYPTLGLATLLQYREKLTDRQAEEASRLRVDWKYALHFPMFYPGIPHHLLCDYRQWVIQEAGYRQELQHIVECLSALEVAFGRAPAEETAAEVVRDVCMLSRLEQITLDIHRTLEALATHHPTCLRSIILPHWYTHYHLFSNMADLPSSQVQQEALAEALGEDIEYLINSIEGGERRELERMEELQCLRQTWVGQFEPSASGGVRFLARCTFCGNHNPRKEVSGQQ